MTSSRLFVAQLLKKMDFSAYSNILLDNALSKCELSLQDKKFATSLFYGVLERKITLDHIISAYSSKPIEELDKIVIQILRIGIYQLLYMNSVPDSAAVDESVKLTRELDCYNGTGFVNAVLRSFVRSEKDMKLPSDWLNKTSVVYSCPVWLVELWEKEFGREKAEKLCENTVGKADVSIRVNTLKTTDEKLIRLLEKDGIKAQKNKYIEHCLDIESGALEYTKAFKDGLFHVQDMSSQMCCMALNPQENEVILDVCAAPGGKTFTIAEMAADKAQIYAYDLHEKRVKLIRQGAERLGLHINANPMNAKNYDESVPMADKILCDVPCAGLGVIRKKPEIKYKNPDDFKNLPDIQYEILENASKYLKVGGELVYSTCSLNSEENQAVIEKFLRNNKNFEGVGFLTDMGKPFGAFEAVILPEHFGGDGFFVSKIRKIR